MMTEDLLTIIQKAEEVIKADGCARCAYVKVDEWEMPCVKCKRNCKDYWRSSYSYDEDLE